MHGSVFIIYEVWFKKDSFFSIHIITIGSSPFTYVFWKHIYISVCIPLPMGGKRISWSTPLWLFSCLTMHPCSLFIESSATVSQLNFMYVSLVFMVFPSWDSRTLSLPFSLQYTLITSGKNFSRRQRYVPALWIFVSATEGRKMVGLGEMSESKRLPVGKYKKRITREIELLHGFGKIWNTVLGREIMTELAPTVEFHPS